MKKNYFIFRFLLVLFCVLHFGKSFSQAITINTSTYTPAQLATNVFSNASCNAITNVTSSSGGGVAYFQNSNPNFPLQSGIVLSSGYASLITGVNTQISTVGSGLSDANLATILGVSNFTDASFLSYNFVANSNSLSFDYLFASEEYGNYQCTFSDGIAFILTDLVTGISTNLAIVPGTTLPVSTNTIRNNLYNTNCASVNSQFFGSYNETNPVSTSGTNFNGQTIKMTANGAVIPNRAYKLKIVVADRLDSQFDSAIFLGANSFNSGVPNNVLGPDVYLCSGTTQVLQTNLNASNYTFAWKKDGVIISNENMPSLVINQIGTYEVLYANIVSGCVSSDSIVVTAASQIPILIITNPAPVCSPTTVDLTNSSITVGSTPGVLTYWLDSLCTLPIPNPASITQSGTYYIKITNACGFDIKPVVVTIVQAPFLGNISNIYACQYYVLPPLVSGNYFSTPSGNGILIPAGTILTQNLVTIYVYASNGICSSESVFQVIIDNIAQPVISTINNSHEIYISGTNVAQPLLLETQTIPNICFYEWFFDGVAIPNSNSASYLVNTVSTFDVPRNFTVTASSCLTSNCQATSQSFVVTQSPVPTPIGNPNQTFTEGQTLANLVVAGSNIKWYDGALNRNSNSTLLPLSTPLVSGTTYFASQTINGYESPTRLAVLATSAALATNLFNDLDFSLSPNPVNDVLQLKSNEIIKNVTVYSVIGQEFLNLKNTSSEVKLDLSKLTSGNYFVKIETEISQKTYKIIKQ
jgi:Secretion system C-terminal sorting domain